MKTSKYPLQACLHGQSEFCWLFLHFTEDLLYPKRASLGCRKLVCNGQWFVVIKFTLTGKLFFLEDLWLEPLFLVYLLWVKFFPFKFGNNGEYFPSLIVFCFYLFGWLVVGFLFFFFVCVCVCLVFFFWGGGGFLLVLPEVMSSVFFVNV